MLELAFAAVAVVFALAVAAVLA
ncbi:hypothetical protein YPPY92_2161, partial [Yersinia pestis PY-92]